MARSDNMNVMSATRKAEEKVVKLAKLMPNIRGTSSAKKEILCGVPYSTTLYGAPIWYPALAIEKYKSRLVSVERTDLLRIASTYRTVSTVALQVITADIPMTGP